MSRYYSFNPEEILDLSVYQFQRYINNIPVIEGIFRGKKPEEEKEEKLEDNQLLIARAKALGLEPPNKILGDE